MSARRAAPVLTRFTSRAAISFHRVIHDFMIQARRAPIASCTRLRLCSLQRLGTQGGDPTGTGRGGESIYGEKFEDEITRVRGSCAGAETLGATNPKASRAVQELKHTGAGVLSMANAG